MPPPSSSPRATRKSGPSPPHSPATSRRRTRSSSCSRRPGSAPSAFLSTTPRPPAGAADPPPPWTTPRAARARPRMPTIGPSPRASPRGASRRASSVVGQSSTSRRRRPRDAPLLLRMTTPVRHAPVLSASSAAAEVAPRGQERSRRRATSDGASCARSPSPRPSRGESCTTPSRCCCCRCNATSVLPGTLTGAFSIPVAVTGIAAAPVGHRVDRHGAPALMSWGSALGALLCWPGPGLRPWSACTPSSPPWRLAASAPCR